MALNKAKKIKPSKDTGTESSYTNKTRSSKITKKKILPTSRWKMHKDKPITGCKVNKTIFQQNIRKKKNP